MTIGERLVWAKYQQCHQTGSASMQWPSLLFRDLDDFEECTANLNEFHQTRMHLSAMVMSSHHVEEGILDDAKARPLVYLGRPPAEVQLVGNDFAHLSFLTHLKARFQDQICQPAAYQDYDLYKSFHQGLDMVSNILRESGCSSQVSGAGSWSQKSEQAWACYNQQGTSQNAQTQEDSRYTESPHVVSPMKDCGSKNACKGLKTTTEEEDQHKLTAAQGRKGAHLEPSSMNCRSDGLPTPPSERMKAPVPVHPSALAAGSRKEGLVWAKYNPFCTGNQAPISWPSLIFQNLEDFEAYVNHKVSGKKNTAACARISRFAVEMLQEENEQQAFNRRPVLFLGRPLEDSRLVQESDCEDFHEHLEGHMKDLVCCPTAFPSVNLYKDFHAGMDEIRRIPTLSLYVGSWSEKAQKVLDSIKQGVDTEASVVDSSPSRDSLRLNNKSGKESTRKDYPFGVLWAIHLEPKGWTMTQAKRNPLVDYYYVKPDKTVEHGRAGVDYFNSHFEVQDYCRETNDYPSIENEASVVDSSPSRDSLRLKDGSGKESTRKDYPFGVLWASHLEPKGWAKTRATRNPLVDYYYVKPGGSVEHGRAGVDYFKSHFEVEDYCRESNDYSTSSSECSPGSLRDDLTGISTETSETHCVSRRVVRRTRNSGKKSPKDTTSKYLQHSQQSSAGMGKAAVRKRKNRVGGGRKESSKSSKRRTQPLWTDLVINLDKNFSHWS